MDIFDRSPASQASRDTSNGRWIVPEGLDKFFRYRLMLVPEYTYGIALHGVIVLYANGYPVQELSNALIMLYRILQ
jgi:hypothetical protein